VPGYEILIWYGLLVPAGTPKDVRRLHDETLKVLPQFPDVKDRLEVAGFEPRATTLEAYGVFTRSEVAKWAKLVKASGAKPD
jgi:tripartite-type tricarboxylate transporter receptor subunit TctC